MKGYADICPVIGRQQKAAKHVLCTDLCVHLEEASSQLGAAKHALQEGQGVEVLQLSEMVGGRLLLGLHIRGLSTSKHHEGSCNSHQV